MKYFKILQNNNIVGYSEIKISNKFQECIEVSKTEYDEIKSMLNDKHTKKEIKQNKLNELTSWFDNYFDKQLTQSQWQKNFKVSEDPYFKDEKANPKTYADIEELKAQAEFVRETIKSLRDEV